LYLKRVAPSARFDHALRHVRGSGCDLRGSGCDLRGSGCDATLKDVPTELIVKHFLVKGRVQGVGFRWFVHREAAEIGLRGWVKNTDDGHVEVVAAGDVVQMEELKAALHKGSRGSRVDAVIEHLLEEREAEQLGEFQIEGAW
jgi:acylphosphatase